jgi:hypothetical protein
MMDMFNLFHFPLPKSSAAVSYARLRRLTLRSKMVGMLLDGTHGCRAAA